MLACLEEKEADFECLGPREEKAGGEGPEKGLKTAEPMTQTAG